MWTKTKGHIVFLASVYDSATTAQCVAKDILTDGEITGSQQRLSDLYNVAIIFGYSYEKNIDLTS